MTTAEVYAWISCDPTGEALGVARQVCARPSGVREFASLTYGFVPVYAALKMFLARGLLVFHTCAYWSRLER